MCRWPTNFVSIPDENNYYQYKVKRLGGPKDHKDIAQRTLKLIHASNQNYFSRFMFF